MISISNRIQRLENIMRVGSRVIVLSSTRDMSDEDLERFLEAKGISTRTEDLVVSLKRFGEGHPDPWVTIDGVPA